MIGLTVGLMVISIPGPISPGSTRRATDLSILRICFWLPIGACTWLALTPDPRLDIGVASLNHILAFSYLTVALRLAHFDRAGWRPVILWMLAYGIGLELIQSVVPGRTAEIQDLGLDGAGILIGSALYHAAQRLCSRFARRHAGSSVRQAASGGIRPDP